MNNSPDFYGKRSPVVIKATDDITQIGQKAADTLRVSIRKATADVLDAVATMEGIVKYLNEDALAFAEYMEATSAKFENHINQFAQVGHSIANNFRDSKEHILALANTNILPGINDQPPPLKTANEMTNDELIAELNKIPEYKTEPA